MWVTTDRGFFSAVESKGDPNDMVIRGRVRGDLSALCDLVPRPVRIIDGGGTDYPHRVVLSRREWADVLVRLSGLIDYTNFKDSVEARQGEARHDVYMRVWGALIGLEYLPRRRRRRRARQARLEPC